MENVQRRITQEEHRKRVNRMNHYIMLALLVLILIPTVCCIVLFVKVNNLQKQIDTLVLLHKQEYEAASELGESEPGVAKAAGVKSENGGKDAEADLTKDNRMTGIRDKKKKQKVYLTFDDGPSDNTDKVLEILDQYEVHATFFVIGKEDKASKERYKKIYDSGHTLGMHSYSHSYSQIYQSTSAFKKDFKKIQTLLYDVTGEKPTLYRFPGGSSNTVSKVDMKKFIRILNEKEIDYYDWNVICGDATGRKMTSKQMVDSVINGVKGKNTSVVLLHDGAGKTTTVKALPTIIKKLKKMDAEILPITEETSKIQHIKADSVKDSSKKTKKK